MSVLRVGESVALTNLRASWNASRPNLSGLWEVNSACWNKKQIMRFLVPEFAIKEDVLRHVCCQFSGNWDTLALSREECVLAGIPERTNPIILFEEPPTTIHVSIKRTSCSVGSFLLPSCRIGCCVGEETSCHGFSDVLHLLRSVHGEHTFGHVFWYFFSRGGDISRNQVWPVLFNRCYQAW